MAEQSRLELVIEAKNATKRALAGAKRGIKGFASNVRSRFQRIRKAVFSVRGAMVAMAGVGAMAGLAKKAFDLGARIEETANRFRTVFGPAVEEVNGFLDEFAAKAGLSRSEAEDAASSAGGLAQGFGFTQEESAELSQQILKLAGDFTSFHDVPIERTLNAITSAMAGEREQLKQLDVVLRQTEVDQRALAETGKASADALTQQERATATLSLITEKAGVVIGDLNRTQDSAANTARRVAAEWENLRNALATAALPVLSEVLGVADENTSQMEAWSESIQRNQQVITAWGRFVIEAVTFVGQSVATLFRTAFNLGQVIGNAVRGVFSALTATLMNWINQEFIQVVNRLIEEANRIPTVDIQFRMNELPADEFAEDAGTSFDAMKANVEQGVDSMKNLRGAWDEMANASIRAQSAVGGVADEAERAADATERAAQASGGGSGGGARPDFLDQPVSPQPVGQDRFGSGGGGMTVGMDTDQVPTVDRAHLSQLERSKSMWQEIGAEIQKATDNQRAMDQVLANVATQTLTGFTQAFQSAAKAAITGSKSMGEAFSTAMLGAIAQVASALAKMYAAKAAAALGEGLMGNPAAFGAAAKFTAAAAAFGALAGVLQGVASGGGGGAAGAARSGAQGTRDTLDRERERATVVIEGGLLDMSDPRQQRALQRAMEDLSGRRVVIQGG